MNKKKCLIGIDEAGRGPLAGPVAVGMVKVPYDFDWTQIPGVGDSKKVSGKNRETIFVRAHQLQQEGKLDFVVLLGEVAQIDTKGISVVIKALIEKGLKQLKQTPEECFVKLDGSLKAPKEFMQETIIKGDQKELVIGLASILAKETRDTYMCELAELHPGYNFELHKGYGTKAHRRLIFKNGLSEAHRRSYCQNRHLWGKV
jgi:ribonuclease HII